MIDLEESNRQYDKAQWEQNYKAFMESKLFDKLYNYVEAMAIEQPSKEGWDCLLHVLEDPSLNQECDEFMSGVTSFEAAIEKATKYVAEY